MIDTLLDLGEVLITVVLIFLIVILVTRLYGLRTFAKMTSFDFASTIAIGSVIASVIMNDNQSLLKGSLVLLGIVGFQYVFSFMLRTSKLINKITTNTSLFIMKDGKILYENLKSANMSEGQLIAKLREANVFQLSEVAAVVLESTGDVSVLHSDKQTEIDSKLLEGVKEN